MTREQISATVEQIIAAVIHNHDLDADTTILPTSKFRYFGMDEVDVYEVIHRTEASFHISLPDDHITEQSRVGELSELVADLLNEKAARETRSAAIAAAWFNFPEDGRD